MAHLHFKRTRYKTGNLRAAERLAYITGQAQTPLEYSQDPGRDDLVHVATRNLPAWAATMHEYLQAAERYERANGVAFEELKITLPHELSHEQNLALVGDLIDAIAGDTLPCTYAFHDPLTLRETQRQPHIHLLISARMTDAHVRTAAQHFKRWNEDHPERGGARKDPAMNVYHATKAHRLLISDVLNLHLERHGMVQRIHPDTLASRGIMRTPEPKLRPSESQDYRDKGVISPTMAEVLKVRAQRAAQWAMEVQAARTYWTQRKGELGLSPEASPAQSLATIRDWRAQTVTQVPARATTPAQAPSRQPPEDLMQRWETPLLGNRVSKIYHTPGHKNYGDVAPKNQVRFWTEHDAQQAGYRRAANDHYGPGSGQAREHGSPGRPGREQGRQTDRTQQPVWKKLQGLAASLEGEETPGGGGLRVRLHDKEEQDKGLSW